MTIVNENAPTFSKRILPYEIDNNEYTFLTRIYNGETLNFFSIQKFGTSLKIIPQTKITEIKFINHAWPFSVILEVNKKKIRHENCSHIANVCCINISRPLDYRIKSLLLENRLANKLPHRLSVRENPANCIDAFASIFKMVHF